MNKDRLNKNLNKEMVVRTMMKIYNLNSVHTKFVDFWNDKLQPKVDLLKNNYEQIFCLYETSMQKMFVMFESEGFNYSAGIPANEAYENLKVRNLRVGLLDNAQAGIEYDLNHSNKKYYQHLVARPFDIDDIIEDDFEYLERFKDEIILGDY